MIFTSPSKTLFYCQKSIFFALFFALFFHVFGYSAAAEVSYFVPFTSQAPHGNWASPWQDFCEEASVVMVAHTLWQLPITPDFADWEMQIIKQYEELVYGYSKDTSIAETADILRVLYGFEGIVLGELHSVADIRELLARGNLIVAPTAGQLLQNPYFWPPGPLYHMLVIRGIDDERGVFITNDPGTRRGEGLEYDQDVLFNAIHDYNNGDVWNGKKLVMIIPLN